MNWFNGSSPTCLFVQDHFVLLAPRAPRHHLWCLIPSTRDSHCTRPSTLSLDFQCHSHLWTPHSGRRAHHHWRAHTRTRSVLTATALSCSPSLPLWRKATQSCRRLEMSPRTRSPIAQGRSLSRQIWQDTCPIRVFSTPANVELGNSLHYTHSCTCKLTHTHTHTL